MPHDRISNYVVHQRRRVSGWLSRLDAEIISTIMVDQKRRGVKGDALEIGVHHGRTFILLNLCVGEQESAIAIDIFDNQELNIGSRSGKGNFAKFKHNLARRGDAAKAKILSSSSLDVKKDDLAALTAGLRFTSIDGGHWYGAVVNDLRLAAACAGAECVIALDDLFHPDFPEVSAGYYAWLEDKPDFVPICVSRGKLYLSRTGTERYYFEALIKNNYLRFHCKKKTEFLGHEILSFTGRYGGIRGLAQKYISYYTPSLYAYLVRRKAKANGRRVNAVSSHPGVNAPPERPAERGVRREAPPTPAPWR